MCARLGEDAVWFDTSGGLHGSDDWWDRIVAEITERPYFLVVLSPSASASKWVPEEMRIAFRQHVELGKRLLPVRLALSPRRPDWEGIQEFDFSAQAQPERYAAALAELLHVLGVDPAAQAAPTAISTVPAGGVVTPARPLSATERLAQETHTAYGREHWSDVLDKSEILIERGAMTPTLWRERASAAFAVNDARNGLAAVEEALRTDPDDTDTLLLRARLFVKAGDDAQAAATFTRAYAFAPLDDTAKRLLILDDLIAGLSRLKRWDEFTRRIDDARRLAPKDPRWSPKSVARLYEQESGVQNALAPRGIPGAPETCFRCGAANSLGSRFCTTCGYDLSGARGQVDRFLAPNGRPLRCRITVRTRPMAGAVYVLHQDVTTFGRTNENDIVIVDWSLSRRHARLVFHQGQWFAEDMGSATGTFVNGVSVWAPLLLTSGCELRLGDVIMTFDLVS